PITPLSYQSEFSSFNEVSFNSVATLGRVLFYDTNLSSDNSVSCASCHQQHLAFADDKAFSKGIMNRSTDRNSIALGVFKNFASYSSDPTTRLFWDGRVDNIHDQMIQTIRNPKEMGMELEDIAEKINDLDYYKVLSQKAFHTEVLEPFLILDALETFMNSISSIDSRFDFAAAGSNAFTTTTFPLFNAQQNLGKTLFTNNCMNCHSQGLEPISNLIKPILSANNGLDLVYSDKGEGEINPSPGAIAIFKVPSLRNIELTAPYMHDGRFRTLEEVVDFYSEGIQDHQNLNDLLKENGHAKKFNFTQAEKEGLIAFLKTLTDYKMTNEVKWSDPFL
ncbi:MAG TPA: cytochrome c peroxidase, partial [Saprospiraceae bacterium]|nr:cytochrome c peroxidase [Saprospiraceae bacterium]